MKRVVVVLVFLPLVAFCFAGFLELRAQRHWNHKLRSLVPIILGILAFAASFVPGNLVPVTPDLSATISRGMTIVCAVIACSGVVVPYYRRASAILVAFGGLVLALFWMFNRVLD